MATQHPTKHPPIIPLPRHQSWTGSTLSLGPTCFVHTTNIDTSTYPAELLQELLRDTELNFAETLPPAHDSPYITLKVDSDFFAHFPEGIGIPSLDFQKKDSYLVTVTEKGVVLRAHTVTGLVYAVQTLACMLQAAPTTSTEIGASVDVTNVVEVPMGWVVDFPEYEHRGFMLDEGRHFQGADVVKSLLDIMCMHKMNVFHWHLTEDQGWRIEVKRYPRLTSIGSYRQGTATSRFTRGDNGIPHGGYYTQDAIRDIVQYAKRRCITIIPEFDVPGHCVAALAAYPHLSCKPANGTSMGNGGANSVRHFDVACQFGIFSDTLCPSNPEVFKFVCDVFEELLELFPSELVHMGGDEAPCGKWKECECCREKVAGGGSKSFRDLQHKFTNDVVGFLQSKGRRVVGWSEVANENLHPDAIIQYWLKNHSTIAGQMASQGRKVIASSFRHVYLDHSHQFSSLSDTYAYDPILSFSPPVPPEIARNCVLGIEAPLWTEWVNNRERLAYQTFPRLTAVAETAWTPRNLKNYPDFHERLARGGFARRLRRKGMMAADDYEPHWARKIFSLFTLIRSETSVYRERMFES